MSEIHPGERLPDGSWLIWLRDKLNDEGLLSQIDDCRITDIAAKLEQPAPGETNPLLPPISGFTLTPDEFAMLKQAFRHTGGTHIDMGMNCVEKLRELMDAIYKRTGVGFEVYT